MKRASSPSIAIVSAAERAFFRVIITLFKDRINDANNTLLVPAEGKILLLPLDKVISICAGLLGKRFGAWFTAQGGV